MESKYDQKAWEEQTSLGRRLYIHNFGMNGTEFAGWELVKTTIVPSSADASEKIYVWQRKNRQSEQIVQVRVVESNYWRHALQHQHEQLIHSMNPDIPQGKGKTVKIGDIRHVGQTPDNKTAAVLFTRGNLQISVRSVGLDSVDVTSLAVSLDKRLAKPPSKAEEKRFAVTRQKPVKVKAKKHEMAVVIDTLPEPTPKSGWTKVLTSQGEIRKEGDTLYVVDDKGGETAVEVLNFKLEQP